MNIVYILPSLEKMGGAERIITEKADYLIKHFGYKVCIICLFQNEDSPNALSLSKSIRQINLGIQYHTQYRYKYPIRLLVKKRIIRDMRNKLSKIIYSIAPDIIIGVSYSQADLVCSIPNRAKKIIECHEPKSLIISSIYSGSYISKLYAKWIYIRTIEKKADLVVTLTKDDQLQWHNVKRTEVIPNFSPMQIKQHSTCKKKRVIAVGRLHQEKGFDRLISIWASISAKYTDWQLDIYGDGIIKDQLIQIIQKNNVKNICLRGGSQNISEEYANSSICAVTSYFEGFSLVILEAMKHGVPCIAFDCPNGPRNIIEDGKNGFLIEDGNNSLYIEKLCTLIESEQLRQHFSKASIERSKYFDTDNIMLKWKNLFEELVKK